MKETRLVLWPQHGIYGAGKDMDEVFGLIETAEKAAEGGTMSKRKAHLQTITDENLKNWLTLSKSPSSRLSWGIITKNGKAFSLSI